MKFRTKLTPAPSGLNIDHSTHIFMLGSCFSEHIAARLQETKFAVVSNPMGILFNPLSICETLHTLAQGHVYEKEELEFDKPSGRWFHYDFHGSFSGTDADRVLDGINTTVRNGRAALAMADVVFITFGGAWIYELKSNGRVVANCHKQHDSNFLRRRLNEQEVYDRFAELLRTTLRDKRVIFTLSPVRHLADGFEENFISKATLRLAIERLEREFDNVGYFPAYEIVNDDLRDYRFYADDLVHPTPMAVAYVWLKFTAWGLSPHAQSFLPRLEKMVAATKHRTSENGGTGNARFFATMHTFVEELARDLPEADFAEELKLFE